MKILHTSDWHLGRSLYGRKRYTEFAQFLDWLLVTIEQEYVDVLLVAGDIFDTSTPSNRAQTLYYQFLCRMAASNCRHVVVIAGNHDSPTFLDAPQEILRTLDIHIVGSVSENPADEVILLKDQAGTVELIVCAVPYLRDRDIRSAEAGESIDDKGRKLIEGLQTHYANVCALAEEKRKALDPNIPLVTMGHLFTAGGQTIDGDGVKELYVGSLAHVTSAIFPDYIDYLALGHLHVPQKLNASEIMRYSGSPIPMGFGEAKQQKSVCVVEFDQKKAHVTSLVVPVFQPLERIKGNYDEISAHLSILSAKQNNVWLEVVYTGEEVMGDLTEQLEKILNGTDIQLLRVKNNRIIEQVLHRMHDETSLDDLNEHEVFQRCLDKHEVPKEQREELLHAYQEIMNEDH